jgi:exodeoxyribonuclease VII small subunit
LQPQDRPATRLIRRPPGSICRPAGIDSTLDVDKAFSYCFPMSKPARAGDAARGSLPFEEALKKLEGIVEVMEADDLPLETLLARYEEGARLVKICQEKLAEAEIKIQQLEKNAAGELKLKPLELSEEE